ncbi:Probable ATP-dependent RNA helicase DDX56 [Lemmus lemmus]
MNDFTCDTKLPSTYTITHASVTFHPDSARTKAASLPLHRQETDFKSNRTEYGGTPWRTKKRWVLNTWGSIPGSYRLSLTGWSRPTLIQEKAIPLALEGKDLLAHTRTGSGKTAAYAIPMLQLLLHKKATGPVMEQAVRGFVLVPTKELARQAQSMIQQLAAYSARDVQVANVSAAEDSASQRAVLMEKPDVVVGIPSRY